LYIRSDKGWGDFVAMAHYVRGDEGAVIAAIFGGSEHELEIRWHELTIRAEELPGWFDRKSLKGQWAFSSGSMDFSSSSSSRGCWATIVGERRSPSRASDIPRPTWASRIPDDEAREHREDADRRARHGLSAPPGAPAVTSLSML
jgi:hypothetical protein